MSTKTILVTGGAGFIGSNFLEYFMNKYDSYKVINLDKLTYAGSLDNLAIVEKNPNYSFVKGDICDRALIEKIFSENSIQGVIHFAAESHVDNSIERPDEFIRTNINGTFTLLDVAKRVWTKAPFKTADEYANARFLHISTDEVYGTLGPTGLFTETTPYAPNSPYSASKASSDMIVRSYFHTFGLNVVTTNCSNNYGPKQHEEKLIPVIIKNALNKKSIPIYGDGSNVRDWLYVEDHASGIDAAFHEGVSGEVYNIGGNSERTNNQVVNTICEVLDHIEPIEGSYKQFITYVKDRPGHDQRYAIDASKIQKQLGWAPKSSFEDGIAKTVKWYLKLWS